MNSLKRLSLGTPKAPAAGTGPATAPVTIESRDVRDISSFQHVLESPALRMSASTLVRRDMAAVLEPVTPGTAKNGQATPSLGPTPPTSDPAIRVGPRSKSERPANSTSTIYMRGTMSNPKGKEVQAAIAVVLHVLLSENAISGGVAPAFSEKSPYALFDERSYVAVADRKQLMSGWVSRIFHRRSSTTGNSRPHPSSPDDSGINEGLPDVEEVKLFVMNSSRKGGFSPEVTIMGLVLLNRLLTLVPALRVTAYNWRLLWLSSLWLSQKTWDDESLANIDFPVLWERATDVKAPLLTPKTFSRMEILFLSLVNYNVFISAPLYAQFAFELRDVFENTLCPTEKFPLKPLSKADTERLEGRTKSASTKDKARISKSAGDIFDSLEKRGGGRGVIS